MKGKNKPKIILGDCLDALKEVEGNAVDLIVTSPPYADRRAKTYGGIKPEEYVAWFLPRSEQFLRILKPEGTFILNIKEKVENGERHTYVIELILELRKQGWLWTEEFIWHKKIAIRENGQTDFVIPGKGFSNLIRLKISKCIRMK